jgi:single-strand DNA-binding protein
MQVLTGRITADAVVNNVKDEKQVVNFSIALNHSYKNGEGERVDRTTFVNCAYWRNTTIATYLKKGAVVEVAGHLSVNAYSDMQGNAKASLNFHTNDITLHGGAKSSEENSDATKKDRKKGTRKNSQKAEPAEVTEPADDLPF